MSALLVPLMAYTGWDAPRVKAALWRAYMVSAEARTEKAMKAADDDLRQSDILRGKLDAIAAREAARKAAEAGKPRIDD